MEEPIVSFAIGSMAQDTFESKVCHHCMAKFSLSGNYYFPSPWVTGIRFCSWHCLGQAQSYHFYESLLLADFLNCPSVSMKLFE